MSKIIGVFMILIGVVVGLYVGIDLMFVRGIIQFVNGVKAEPTNGNDIAWGVVRVFFAGLVGWGAGAVFILPGGALVFKD